MSPEFSAWPPPTAVLKVPPDVLRSLRRGDDTIAAGGFQLCILQALGTGPLSCIQFRKAKARLHGLWLFLKQGLFLAQAEVRLRHYLHLAVQAADVLGELLQLVALELLGNAGHHAIAAPDERIAIGSI